jgi:hypothetical protein
MERDESLGVLMAGFRGTNLSDADFADSGQAMRFLEASGDAEGLPLVYDPAAISAYWWARGHGVWGWSRARAPAGQRATGGRTAACRAAPPPQQARCAARLLSPPPPAPPAGPHPTRDVRPVSVVRRITQLMSIAGSFFSGLLSDLALGRVKQNEVTRAIQLREIVTSLGPAYIKLGQVRGGGVGWGGCGWGRATAGVGQAACSRAGAAAGPLHGGGSCRKGGVACGGPRGSLRSPPKSSPGANPSRFPQALSIRPDILSPAAMGELQKLCDKVPSFDSAIAMQVGRRGGLRGREGAARGFGRVAGRRPLTRHCRAQPTPPTHPPHPLQSPRCWPTSWARRGTRSTRS